MNVKSLIEYLKMFPKEAEVLVCSDEEMNTIYKEFQVAVLTKENEADDDDAKQIVIYGLSGTECEEEY